MTVCRRGPRFRKNEGSPRVIQFLGAQWTALALANYASQCGSHRPTQDSLPTAGQALSGGIGYPQGSDERFPRRNRYIPSSFPKLAWRNVTISPISHHFPISRSEMKNEQPL